MTLIRNIDMDESFLFRDNPFEDFEEFWPCYFPIMILINHINELIDLCFSNISILVHVFESIIDESGDFIGFQGATFVFIIDIEYNVNSVSQILI